MKSWDSGREQLDGVLKSVSKGNIEGEIDGEIDGEINGPKNGNGNGKAKDNHIRDFRVGYAIMRGAAGTRCR
jgi:hypothetical protein